jgi:hypothetical protein
LPEVHVKIESNWKKNGHCGKKKRGGPKTFTTLRWGIPLGEEVMKQDIINITNSKTS